MCIRDSTRTVAQDAFEILRTKGLLFQTVTITAKEKLCFCEKTECTPEKCPWAKGHFDRVNDAVYELWTAGQFFSREKILEQAEKLSLIHICIGRRPYGWHSCF